MDHVAEHIWHSCALQMRFIGVDVVPGGSFQLNVMHGTIFATGDDDDPDADDDDDDDEDEDEEST